TDTELSARVLRTFWNDTDDAVAFELLPPLSRIRPMLLGYYLDKDWPEAEDRLSSARWLSSGCLPERLFRCSMESNTAITQSIVSDVSMLSHPTTRRCGCPTK